MKFKKSLVKNDLNYFFIFILFFSFFVFIVLLLYNFDSYNFSNIVVENVSINDFKFYFCSRVDCNNIIVENLNNSNNVFCAFYNVKDKNVVDLLRQKNVFLIVNSKNFVLDKNNISYVFRNNYYSRGLMHNKFCVFEKSYKNNIVKSVFTGSFNPTNNNSYDLLVFFNSSFLYENYKDEYFELKNKIFSSGEKTKFKKVDFCYFYIYNFFCPEDDCKKNILEFISKAKNNITVFSFSLTDDDFSNLLLYKHNNVSINVFVDSKSLNFLGSDIFSLKDYVNVFVENSSKLLHHKVVIVDEDFIIFGSPNFSYNGFFYNDENIIVLERKKSFCNNVSSNIVFDNILKQFYLEEEFVKNNSFVLK